MAAVGLTFLFTIALCPLVLACLRRWRVVDVPDHRSSHAEPTPRGGGVTIALGASVALAVTTVVTGEPRAGLLAASVTFGAIGLLEDAVGIPALRRLALQVVAGLAAVPWLLASWDGSPGWRLVAVVVVVLWLVSYVNAFNFMDGIDGISVVQAVVAGGAWYAIGRGQGVPALANGGLIVAAGALAFAPFNFPRAHMFLGDVGSYFVGAWLAALAVIGLRAGVPAEAIVAPLTVYLADTGVTLGQRVRRGEVWHAPHRDHAYQRLVQQGWSHVRTTAWVGVAMLVVTGLGALSLTGSVPLRAAGDVAILAVLAAYLGAPSWLARRGRRAPTAALDPA